MPRTDGAVEAGGPPARLAGRNPQAHRSARAGTGTCAAPLGRWNGPRSPPIAAAAIHVSSSPPLPRSPLFTPTSASIMVTAASPIKAVCLFTTRTSHRKTELASNDRCNLVATEAIDLMIPLRRKLAAESTGRRPCPCIVRRENHGKACACAGSTTAWANANKTRLCPYDIELSFFF